MSLRYVKILTMLIFFASLAMYCFRLGQIQSLVWDEEYHVLAAQSYSQSDRTAYLNRNNPPLGKELIALSMKILGDNFFAYRLPSALAAAGVAALLFFLGTRLASRWIGGLLAAGLWLSSTLAYVHARLATLDMMTTFFFIASLAAFLPVLWPSPPAGSSTTKAPSSRDLSALYLACFLAALGANVKVLCYLLFPLLLLGLVLARQRWPLKSSLAHLFFATLIFSLLGLILSYGLLGFSPGEIPGELKKMVFLQSKPHREYLSLSPWYEWFLLQASHWYPSQLRDSGDRIYVWCSNNPVLWVAGSFGVVFLFIFGRKQPYYTVLAAAIPLQIAFWAVFKKQTILYYGLPMEPIFCLCAMLALYELSRKLGKDRIFFNSWAAVLLAASGYYIFQSWAAMQGVIR
jgi:4-amino-4-deoxy-L-arabinose transferase and related glycosyltransferases of PMT family